MFVEDAIKHFKTGVALADALGITSGAISQWGELVPEGQAGRLEKMTDGKLVYDPDVYRKKKTAA